MLPRDVTGVFSRSFVVGFFAPAFFWLAALKLALGERLLPEVLEPHTGKAFLVLGAAALLAALLLSGLERQVSRVLMGHYSLSVVGRWLISRHAKAYASCKAHAASQTASPERARARRRLDEQFPHNPANLLPTRYGNAVRATRDYMRTRWGLREHAVWPRIQMLMSEQESEVRSEAKAVRAFFINGSLGALLAGLVLVVDAVLEHPHSPFLAWIYGVPFLLTYLLYRGAVDAAVQLGLTERAALDLHRLDLYERLGVPSHDRDVTVRPDAAARRLSDFLSFGPEGTQSTPSDEGGAVP
jgi:hypothetical protein